MESPASTLEDSDQLLMQIMARQKGTMMRMSYIQLQDKTWAEIAVANIFMVVYKRLSQYPGIPDENAWVCRTAVVEWRRLNRRKALGLKPLIRTQRR